MNKKINTSEDKGLIDPENRSDLDIKVWMKRLGIEKEEDITTENVEAFVYICIEIIQAFQAMNGDCTLGRSEALEQVMDGLLPEDKRKLSDEARKRIIHDEVDIDSYLARANEEKASKPETAAESIEGGGVISPKAVERH